MDRALDMSAANLRQFMLTEGVETLANELKNSLENLSESDIVQLIKGRQVELAEELKYIRKIHGLLHELNRMLNQVYGHWALSLNFTFIPFYLFKNFFHRRNFSFLYFSLSNQNAPLSNQSFFKTILVHLTCNTFIYEIKVDEFKRKKSYFKL